MGRRRILIVKEKFQRAYSKLPETQKNAVDFALKSFQIYLDTQKAAAGLGVKHLGSNTYEFRAGIDLRIVYIAEKDSILLTLIGTHDEVRRYLKNF